MDLKCIRLLRAHAPNQPFERNRSLPVYLQALTVTGASIREVSTVPVMTAPPGMMTTADVREVKLERFLSLRLAVTAKRFDFLRRLGAREEVLQLMRDDQRAWGGYATLYNMGSSYLRSSAGISQTNVIGECRNVLYEVLGIRAFPYRLPNSHLWGKAQSTG